MTSPYSQQNLQTDPTKINRIAITVNGVAGTGKSAIAGFILGALRAQGFQSGLTDPLNDQPPVAAQTRFAQNTIVTVEVTDSGVEQVQERVNAQLNIERTKNLELVQRLKRAGEELVEAQKEGDRLISIEKAKVEQLQKELALKSPAAS